MSKNVTFPIAKLLKEKGFNEPCEDRFDNNGIPTATKLGMHMHPNNYSDSYSAPLISDVVDWLLEKHGIWIFVQRASEIINYEAFDKFQPVIEFIPQTRFVIDDLEKFEKPKEAYLAAIEYTLKNII